MSGKQRFALETQTIDTEGLRKVPPPAALRSYCHKAGAEMRKGAAETVPIAAKCDSSDDVPAKRVKRASWCKQCFALSQMLTVFYQRQQNYAVLMTEATEGGLLSTPVPISYEDEMMAKQKHGLPATTAGLVRYFDEYREAVQIKPEWVLGFTLFIVLMSFFLRPYIPTLFGV